MGDFRMTTLTVGNEGQYRSIGAAVGAALEKATAARVAVAEIIMEIETARALLAGDE